jgi:hypothetical protein
VHYKFYDFVGTQFSTHLFGISVCVFVQLMLFERFNDRAADLESSLPSSSSSSASCSSAMTSRTGADKLQELQYLRKLCTHPALVF